ncbi:MAG: hypothetical protein NW215_03860, partial [Hyphomicrobiales bacterium]|nr:hypothetical protein [Hyphomicrobiales bacterium]
VTNGQALNRYSYVLNNPLSYTDPSGFFFQSLFKAIGRALGAVFRAIGRVFNALLKSGIFRSIVQVVACAGASSVGAAALCAGLVSGGLTLASGGSLSDALQAGAMSAAMAGVYTGIGKHLTAIGATAVEKVATHGVVGGAFSVAQGGEFHTGFVTGAVGKAAGLATESSELQGIQGFEGKFVRTAVAATAGGTASVLSGGKFGNGAVTAAFAHMYNQEGDKDDELGTTRPGETNRTKDWCIRECSDLVFDTNRFHPRIRTAEFNKCVQTCTGESISDEWAPYFPRSTERSKLPQQSLRDQKLPGRSMPTPPILEGGPRSPSGIEAGFKSPIFRRDQQMLIY